MSRTVYHQFVRFAHLHEVRSPPPHVRIYCSGVAVPLYTGFRTSSFPSLGTPLVSSQGRSPPCFRDSDLRRDRTRTLESPEVPTPSLALSLYSSLFSCPSVKCGPEYPKTFLTPKLDLTGLPNPSLHYTSLTRVMVQLLSGVSSFPSPFFLVFPVVAFTGPLWSHRARSHSRDPLHRLRTDVFTSTAYTRTLSHLGSDYGFETVGVYLPTSAGKKGILE